MKTRPTPETDAHKRHMDHESFLSELAETYTLAKRLEQERDEAREQAAELLEALEVITELFKCTGAELVALNGEPTSYEKARAAIAKAKGVQP